MISGIRTHIFIGDQEILRCPGCRIEFVRHRPLSRAAITLPDPKGELYRSIKNDRFVEIRTGYRNEEPAIWKGMVSWKKRGSTKDQIEVGVVGRDEKTLCSFPILQAWENETPEAIIKWSIGQAGLSPGRIDSPGVTIPRFAASNIPVWQVARQCAHTCQKAFGIDMSRWAFWMGADGKVNWGDFDEPGDMHVIATGAGLIKHLPSSAAKGLNVVETFLLAGFRHSMQFRLIDTLRDIDDEFRALQVFHEIKERSVRTFIGYGEEYEKH